MIFLCTNIQYFTIHLENFNNVVLYSDIYLQCKKDNWPALNPVFVSMIWKNILTKATIKKNYYQKLTNFKSEEKSEKVHYIIRQAKASLAFTEINPISRSNHNRYQ